ncbi:transcript variant X2 [Nothobranchius furzeri]|uniref:Transcript variant X2 n=2 Tax=Nothobranchius furzeri TaxID=105023 RepID=A0A9D2YA55_NOTFU|nr:transcript variant X2 [Nothobranchius furzeri]
MNQLDTSSFSDPDGFCQTLQRVQNTKSILRDHLFTSNPINQEEHQKSIPADCTSDHLEQNKKVSHQGCLPWWFIFVGWLLVIGTSVIAGYFTMLYGLKFGKERSISWLVSMVISFFHSLLLIQPIKVICLAVFFALVIKKVEGEDFQNVVFEKSEKTPGDENNQHTRRWEGSLYEPPPPADIERMKRKKILEQKAFALLTEILTYLGFMWMLLLVAFGQKDPNAFFLNQHIINSFTQNVPDSVSTQGVFMWANTSLLPNLFGEFQGFITDGKSKLVGNARLRQLRVQKNSCQVAGSMLTFVSNCNAVYSWEMEDMGSYEPGWNHSLLDNISTSTSRPWKYQTQSELRNRPFWGRLETYRGGGYVADLGPNLLQARGTLDYLWNNKWLDEYTRAVFAEFTVYNANVNLFCIVTFLMETAAVGAFRLYSELQIVRLYQAMDGLYFSVMVAEILYLLFILYYMFQQGKLMKQQRWSYFKNKWNLLELSIILLSWSAVALFIKRTLLGNRDLAYYQNHKDQFASFYDTATADIMLQYSIAFLVLLSNIKLWHLLRLNPKMNLITAALRRASTHIFLNLVVIAIILVAYAVTSNIIYGWELASYKTFTSALLTLICLQIGIFNFDEVLNDDHLIGGLLFGSCTILLTFVVLNLFVAVILVSLEEEQKQHKPSEEEEVVDLLLNNICSLFGIRYKNEKKLMGLDVNGSGALAVNNSRDFLNTSSADVNIYQKTGH